MPCTPLRPKTESSLAHEVILPAAGGHLSWNLGVIAGCKLQRVMEVLERVQKRTSDRHGLTKQGSCGVDRVKGRRWGHLQKQPTSQGLSSLQRGRGFRQKVLDDCLRKLSSNVLWDFRSPEV